MSYRNTVLRGLALPWYRAPMLGDFPLMLSCGFVLGSSSVLHVLPWCYGRIAFRAPYRFRGPCFSACWGVITSVTFRDPYAPIIFLPFQVFMVACSSVVRAFQNG